ncbi:MAG: CRTAC1 family protein, partial [Planctomycetales bacterium]|nr:CRTAC1 family protein [Planctomycetales bacterium]
VTETAGVKTRHRNAAHGAKLLPETMGGGCAFFDCDNDGDQDLFVATLNASRHRLYVNDGAGNFVEEGAVRGLLIDDAAKLTTGTSASWGDYDRDGYLDLFVTSWSGFTATGASSQARLFRNLGTAGPGQFVDVTASAGVTLELTSGFHAGQDLSFTSRFADFDQDGWPDLAVASDGKTSRLFWNRGDGTFEDGTAAAGVNTGTNDMGLAVGDVNGDGRLDWFATSIGFALGRHPSGNRRFLNQGDRTFVDATDAAGVREGGWGWAAALFDFDNDGDLDVAHANGMTIGTPEQADAVFFRNDGDAQHPQFVEVAAEVGLAAREQGRGLLTFDYDHDGDLDLFIVNYDEPPRLYRNDQSEANHWLQVQAVGDSSNRDGLGALVVTTVDLVQPAESALRAIDGGSNYLSQSEPLAHFGLGDAEVVDLVEVCWPSGLVQRFYDVAADQRLIVVEGLLADADGDADVDSLDWAAWGAAFGTGEIAPGAPGDADGSGRVDGRDALIWQR